MPPLYITLFFSIKNNKITFKFISLHPNLIFIANLEQFLVNRLAHFILA